MQGLFDPQRDVGVVDQAVRDLPGRQAKQGANTQRSEVELDTVLQPVGADQRRAQVQTGRQRPVPVP